MFSDEEAMGGVLRGGGDGWVPLLGAGSYGWKGRGRKWGNFGGTERELAGGYAGVAANGVPGWACMGLLRLRVWAVMGYLS